MKKKNFCYNFSIPRGETSRYVYVFNYKGSYYIVTKKVLYSNLPYLTISKVIVPTNLIQNYINTVVALTY
jgi:hypothetical protein